MRTEILIDNSAMRC